MITAVKRFSKAEEQPSEAEEALLFWVNQSLHALRFATTLCHITFKPNFSGLAWKRRQPITTLHFQSSQSCKISPTSRTESASLLWPPCIAQRICSGRRLPWVTHPACPTVFATFRLALTSNLMEGEIQFFYLAALPSFLQRLAALQHLSSVN